MAKYQGSKPDGGSQFAITSSAIVYILVVKCILSVAFRSVVIKPLAVDSSSSLSGRTSSAMWDWLVHACSTSSRCQNSIGTWPVQKNTPTARASVASVAERAEILRYGDGVDKQKRPAIARYICYVTPTKVTTVRSRRDYYRYTRNELA